MGFVHAAHPTAYMQAAVYIVDTETEARVQH